MADRAPASGQRRRLTREAVLDTPVEEVFAWHERPGAVQRLVPPWEPVRIEQEAGGLDVGSRTVFRTSIPGPVAMRWVAEHTRCDPPREFHDTQVNGPFPSWEHRHRFEKVDDQRTRITDDVEYELPLRQLGGDAAWPLVQSRLRRMFDYRYRQLADDLATHRGARERGFGALHVVVTGSTGLIGTSLVALLRSGGHRVTRLVRRAPQHPDEAYWDPSTGRIDQDALQGADAVVHLAGASIATRWTQEQKQRIQDSRVQGTRLLAQTLASMEGGPQVLVCSSGISFYGYDRGDVRLTARSEAGGGFLADVARAWEAAADPAREVGIRVVHVRTGLVLSPAGGVLQLQLPLFQAGMGGRLGSGKQWMSWISIDDIVGIFHHALTTPGLSGPINGTAPQPVTNNEFTRVLGEVLRRPTLLTVPKIGPSLLLGEQGARETAFASQRVLPERTDETGYTFRQPNLERALRHVLGR